MGVGVGVMAACLDDGGVEAVGDLVEQLVARRPLVTAILLDQLLPRATDGGNKGWSCPPLSGSCGTVAEIIC